MTRLPWFLAAEGGDEVPPVPALPITLDGARDLLAYSRSSNERVLGIHGQDEEIREWAEFNGYSISGFVHDVKVHGKTPVDERAGLDYALRLVEAKEAAGIVVRSLDRLSRDPDVQDEAVERVWAVGGRFFSSDFDEWEPDLPGSRQRKLRHAAARLYSVELDVILPRLQNGRRRKMARGGYGGGGRLARRYGVELVSIQGRLEYRPVPAEQAVIRRVCSTCSAGAGYSATARTLNAEGVRTATGAPWSAKTVRDLARRGPDRLVAIPREIPLVAPEARTAVGVAS